MTNSHLIQRIAKPSMVRAMAAEESSAATSSAASEKLVSFGVSVMVHLSLLLVLAVFVYNHSSESPSLEAIEAKLELQPSSETIALMDVVMEELQLPSESTNPAESLKSLGQLSSASEPPLVTLPDFSDQGVLTKVSPHEGQGLGGDALAGWGERIASGVIAGEGQKEQGDGEVSFFGTKAKGNSFVFIVDCSGSMTTPTSYYHPRLGPMTRFLRARQELYSSLGQLARNQSYSVIFYNHGTFPMFFPEPASKLVLATPKNLQRTSNWIQNVMPGGGTDPRHAFQLALALRPQVIFFLTDGEIPSESRLVAKEHNKSRTRIHTIAFGLPENHDILQGIATDNQGRFRYVP